MNARYIRHLAVRRLAVRNVGGAMIALLALGPGAHAEMDLFSAYYNNVARAAAANDAATVARLVAGEGSKPTLSMTAAVAACRMPPRTATCELWRS